MINSGSVTDDLGFYYWILINLRQRVIIINLEHTMKFNVKSPVKVKEPAKNPETHFCVNILKENK